MRCKIVLFLLVIVTQFNGVQLFAQSVSGTQGPPPPNTSRTPLPPIDAMVPIDDNLIILVVMGLFLGAYFVYKNRVAKKAA